MNFKLAFLVLVLLGYTIPISSMLQTGSPDSSPCLTPQDSPIPSRPASPEPAPTIQTSVPLQQIPAVTVPHVSQPNSSFVDRIAHYLLPIPRPIQPISGTTPQVTIAPEQSPQAPKTNQPEGWFSRTLNNADTATNAARTTAEAAKTTAETMKTFIDEKDATISHALKVDPNSMDKFKSTWVSLMKTYLTATIGGAIAVTGVILFFKTIMKEKSTKPDTRPLYQRILTNRYLISALLMATGTGIILKSDAIVASVS